MGERRSYSHSTPLNVKKHLFLEDSGYLTTTPDSTESQRVSSRFDSGLGIEEGSLIETRYKLSRVNESPYNVFNKSVDESPCNVSDTRLLFTPEYIGLGTQTPLCRNAFSNYYKPFPISDEEAHDIKPIDLGALHCKITDNVDTLFEEDMCVADDDQKQNDLEDFVYVCDPMSSETLDSSMYEILPDKKVSVVASQEGSSEHGLMDVDDLSYLWPPSSSQDDRWSNIPVTEIHDKRKKLESNCNCISTKKGYGSELLSQKLQKLSKEQSISKDRSTKPSFFGWRDQQYYNGCKVAKNLSGKSTVDFISYLGHRSNHSHIVARIFSYLPVKDLHSSSLVSKAWQQSVSRDSYSKCRLGRYTADNSVHKENIFAGKGTSQQHKGPLVTIDNLQYNKVSPPSSPPGSPGRDLKRAIASLGKTAYKPCPKCHFPTKIATDINVASCMRNSCQYSYCLKCFYVSHHPKPCSNYAFVTGRKRPVGVGPIGGKQSKKNLRRLL